MRRAEQDGETALDEACPRDLVRGRKPPVEIAILAARLENLRRILSCKAARIYPAARQTSGGRGVSYRWNWCLSPPEARGRGFLGA